MSMLKTEPRKAESRVVVIRGWEGRGRMVKGYKVSSGQEEVCSSDPFHSTVTAIKNILCISELLEKQVQTHSPHT